MSTHVIMIEIGMYLVSRITQAAPDQLEEHIESLLSLFESCMQDAHLPVSVLSIQSLTELLGPVLSELQPLHSRLSSLIPYIMDVFRKVAVVDEASAFTVLDFFEEYADCLSPPSALLRQLTDFFISITASTTFEPHVRVKALTFMEWLLTRKSKSMVKQRLLPVVVQALLGIVSTESTVEGGDDNDDDDDTNENPANYALHVLSCASTYIPAEILFPMMVGWFIVGGMCES